MPKDHRMQLSLVGPSYPTRLRMSRFSKDFLKLPSSPYIILGHKVFSLKAQSELMREKDSQLLRILKAQMSEVRKSGEHKTVSVK